jgi:hypothetical protein
VLNIFKAVAMPLSELIKKKESIRSEIDTVSLVQVGTFRTNDLDINQFSAAAEYIIYKIFNPEKCRIVLEMNHKGEIVYNRFSDNPNCWTGQFVHTKHTEMAVNVKLGLRLGPTNKIKYCERFKYLATINKIIPNEYLTIMELMAFGKSKGGVYRGQNGNDDLAMTCVNLAPLFDTQQFWDIAFDTYENSPEAYRKEVKEKIFDVYRENGSKSLYDFDRLKQLNHLKDSETGNFKILPNVFDLTSLEHMKKIQNKFFKS